MLTDPLAGVSGPSPGADVVGELGHPAEHLVHRRHDVDLVDGDPLVGRRAQRDVQHGAVLGDVDLLAAEHRLDAVAQPGLLGQLDQAAAPSRR